MLKKQHNHQSEKDFHNDWARSIRAEDIDPITPFTGKTSPEYKAVMDFLGNVRGKHILNLGCGLGEEAVYLGLKGAKVTAIDISPQMLTITQRVAKRYGVGDAITCRRMSAEVLNFDNDSFDAVVGCNILHHVDSEQTLREVKRVLKRGGLAVFSEPLAYNPIVNIYRIIANKVRTDHEHPLYFEDLQKMGKLFGNIKHEEYQLFTLLLFVWFYVGERLHPNDVRYWKKIIQEADRYQHTFSRLYRLDCSILRRLPFLKKYCWVTVIRLIKRR